MGEPSLPWPRRLRRRAYWVLTISCLAVAKRVPLAWGRAGGILLARAAMRLRPRERGRAAANLAVVFPELDAAGRERLLAASVRALGRNLHDALVAEKLVGDPERIGFAPPAGAGDFAEVLAGLLRPGRGLLLLTGHFGCWELCGAWVARRMREAGLGELAVVTGTVHNPAVDRLLQQRRRRLGLRPLPRRAGVGPLIAHLRGGGTAAVLLDQNIRARDPAIRFCGRDAPTPDGPARIALKYGVPVLPVALRWDEEAGAHRVATLPALDPWAQGRPAGVATGRQVAAFQAACNAALETFLRGNPAEWVWFHDRWGLHRTSPEDTKR